MNSLAAAGCASSRLRGGRGAGRLTAVFTPVSHTKTTKYFRKPTKLVIKCEVKAFLRLVMQCEMKAFLKLVIKCELKACFVLFHGREMRKQFSPPTAGCGATRIVIIRNGQSALSCRHAASLIPPPLLEQRNQAASLLLYYSRA